MTEVECRYCFKLVDPRATRCPYCAGELVDRPVGPKLDAIEIAGLVICLALAVGAVLALM